MKKSKTISKETRNNWLIDAGVFMGAVVASLTGIYFLFLPIGGYQGGRNPMYGVRIIFDRSTWGDLHLWGGILMIVAAVIHIAIHWKWIVNMTKRIYYDLFTNKTYLNARGRFNAGINAVIAVSFLLTALTGIYLLLFPGGSFGVSDPLILFKRTTWDLIHTWAAISMIIAGVVHFVIHWRWVVKVTGKVFLSIYPSGVNRLSQEQSAASHS